MGDVVPTFRRCLARARRRYCAGLLLRDVLWAAGWGAVALAGYAWADYFLAFSPRALWNLNVLLAALGIVLVAVRMGRSLAVSMRAMARLADQARASRRADVLSAWELTTRPQPTGAGPVALHTYLVAETTRLGLAQLQAWPARQQWPGAALRRQARILLAQLILVGLTLGVPYQVTRVLLARIVHPARDIPPYSRLRFAITPASPMAVYGQDCEIRVDLGGAPVRPPVWFMARDGSRQTRQACFQDSPTGFVRRLEKVTEPVEFCFAVGRARSPWHRVELRLDPRITAARLRVTPPAYSGLPVQTFAAGERELAGLAGSRIELEVTCNRPLARGHLALRATSGGREIDAVTGRVTGPQQVAFDWILRQDAVIDLTVQDLQGLRNQQPLEIRQRLQPDEPPRVAITEPGGFVLATPTAHLRLAGEADDDLGLRRVDLVSTVVGYRDRSVRVGPEEPRPAFAWGRDLDLGQLGVTPGQELEFFLEAMDSNPDLTGMGVSEVARVQIISEEEYAGMLRAQVHAAEFIQRYQVAQQALDSLRDLAQAFADDLAQGKLTEDDIAARWKELQAANRKTGKIFSQLAEDFQVYEAESSFGEVLNEIADGLEEQDEWLAKPPPFADGVPRTVANILDRLGRQAEPLRQEVQNAEEIAAIARLMEEALRYRQLLQAQERLVRRLERERNPAQIRDDALFALLRRQQEETRAGLVQLRDAIRAKAALVPLAEPALQETALEFADAIDDLEIPETMAAATEAAARLDGVALLRQATLALERMRRLLSQCEGGAFGGLAQCQLKFKVPARMQATLGQMLAAWSAGGGSDDGYAMDGYSSLNVPAYGPSRTGLGSQEGLHGQGGEAGRAGRAQVNAEKQGPATVPRPGQHRMTPATQAPEKYRDALKRYFANPEVLP